MGFGGFGVGYAAAIPYGVSNPTPLRFGTLKDWNWDYDGDLKEQTGEGQFVEDALVGLVKITGAVTFQQVGAATLAAAVGGTAAAGQKIGVKDEGPTIIPTTPFQITVANGATFFEDLGVFLLDATTGLATPMTRGATATGTGVYAVNTTTGVYTFNTADQGKRVIITYSYTSASTGKTIPLPQRLAGTTSYFQLRFFNNLKDNYGFMFPKVVIPKLAFAPKYMDWADVKVNFTAVVDTPTQKIADICVGKD